MNPIRNSKGQALLLFALFVGALMVGLIANLMISLYQMDRDVSRLKVRMESYQATLQFSQNIQQARATGASNPTCVLVPSGTALTVKITPSGVLCMPNGSVCTSNNKYCIQKNPDYNITKLEGLFEEPQEIAEFTKTQSVSFSFLPEAQAQTAIKSWLPDLTATALPTVTIGLLACDATPAARCTICNPAANATANCFKVRICTNSSSTCTAADTYFDALVAINFRKN